jgi:hypothetical protein
MSSPQIFILSNMISDKTFQLAKNIGFDLKTCNCVRAFCPTVLGLAKKRKSKP